MKPKYRKGAQIETMVSLILATERCRAENEPAVLFYFGDKVQNWPWIQNMSLLTLSRYVARKRVWFAIPVEKSE